MVENWFNHSHIHCYISQHLSGVATCGEQCHEFSPKKLPHRYSSAKGSRALLNSNSKKRERRKIQVPSDNLLPVRIEKWAEGGI